MIWKIMVVEDEKFVRQGIVQGIDWKSLNCEVVLEMSNGLEALSNYHENKVDIIISDIKMPKLNGLELVEKLRQKGSDIPVIILSAYEDFSFAQKAIKLDAVDYLLKPFRDEELREVIMKIQNRARHSLSIDDNFQNAVVSKVYQNTHPLIRECFYTVNRQYNDSDLTVNKIADFMNISESHLSHIFKEETGYTVKHFIVCYRMEKACVLLKDSKNLIYEIADQVGYRDLTYFSSSFKKIIGISPSEYQKKILNQEP